MSNIKKISNKELNYRKQVINFIGSPEYLFLLKEENLSKINFNNLFLYHILTILFQSTGIKEAHVNLVHMLNLEQNNWTPKINFSFYTTKDVLVESSRIGNNTSIRIKNKENNYLYKNSCDLKNFINKYNSELELVSDEEMDSNKIHYKKLKGTQENIINYYDIIMSSSSILNSIILNHFMKKELVQTPSRNNIKPIKI